MRRSTATASSSRAVPLGAVAAVLAAATAMLQASAQSTDSCISLKGSAACPSFQDAYINPSKLGEQWKFFSNVTDVASFDARFQSYLVSNDGYYTDAIANGLQCHTETSRNVTLQWQKTVYCSRFAELSYDAGCSGENEARPPPVCQETCSDFVASEHQVLEYNGYCAAEGALTPTQSAIRQQTLRDNFHNCTDRNSPATSNNATCVLGIENEGSCGYATSIDQLCAHCDPQYNEQLSPCCYDAKTDLSSCAAWGHPRATSIRPTQSIATNIGGSATPTSTRSSASSTSSAAPTGTNLGADQEIGGKLLASADEHILSDGQLAGVIVGCIVGALLLGALLMLLLMRLCRRDRNDTEANRSNNVYANAPGGDHVERAWMQSEEGIKSPEISSAKGDKFAAGAAGAGAALAGSATPLGAAAGKGRESVDDRPLSAMSGETGTDGRGTTIPAVKDQYSSHDICAGETVVAIYPYNATLNDEISLQPDDVIMVQRLYDDGWALGRTELGTEGAFPLVCVTSTKGGTTTGSSRDGLGSSGGATSGNEGNVTSSVDGAVTADEGFTSDATGMGRRTTTQNSSR
ncbi:hypothetical protein ACQY0O_002044 [Thecaphora frezii]